MSLLNPTKKEMLDRLSILERKIIETELVGGADANTLNLLAETEGLWKKLFDGFEEAPPAPQLLQFAVKLAAINAAIWDKIAIGQHGWANMLNRKRAELMEEPKL
jgi:hypothetical protein